MKYDFLLETYRTEQVKVLSVWSEFKDLDLPVRPRQGDPRGRSVHEHMVHLRERRRVISHHARRRRRRASAATARNTHGVLETLCGR
jgi:hypothetical protein